MATRSERTPRLPPAARRAQLLDAALNVLAREGFSAITIEAVAQQAGVTRPVIYDQFGDLETLLLALIDTAEATALAPLLAIVDVQPGDDVDPERFAHDAVLAFLRAVKADPRTWRLVLMPPRGSSRELRERIRAVRRLIADHVTRLLDWGVPRRGGPLGLDHALAARVVVAAGEDAARLMLAHPRRYTPERLVGIVDGVLAFLPADAPRQGLTVPELALPEPPVPLPEPPGARRRMPQTERREQLLDVTLDLLAEEGFAALSMEAIARRSGVNRAVVYRSFANLGVLLLGLLHREDQRLARTLAALLPTEPSGTPGQMLGDTLARFLEAVLAAPSSWRVALLRPESAPVTLQKLVNRRRAALAEQLEPLIAWGVARIALPDPDVEALARVLLSVGEELGRLVLDDPDYPVERVLAGGFALLDRMPG